MSEPGAVRDVAGLGGWTAALLLAQAGVSVIAVAVAWSHGPGFIELSPGYAIVALFQTLVFVAAGVAFLRWTYLTSANAHAFGAQALRYGPWLATLSYFIPIANLAMPLQSLRDVWKASVEPRDWEIVKVPALLGFWWFFWLAGNIAGIAAFRLAVEEDFLEASRTAEMLTTLSDALTAAASVLLALIVRRLTALQQNRTAALAMA
jgi:hypothetical protein